VTGSVIWIGLSTRAYVSFVSTTIALLNFHVTRLMGVSRILRRSFDVTSELIYQTELLNYRIKGDPKARDIEVHALAVIHKKVGSDTVTGFEAYFDQQPIVEVVRELRGRKRPE
jgi:hypothetical protein